MSIVLNKALNVMELFLDRKEELTLSELAEVSRLNITTVNRMVSTLVKRGYLNKSETTKKYSLGKKFLEFSTTIIMANNLRNVALPFLVRLSRVAPETISMISWDGRQGVHVAVIPSRQFLRISPEEWTLFKQPLHSTGTGKAILANMTDRYVEEYCKSTKMVQSTPNSITDPNDLKQHLLIIKREGVAFNDEEQHLGVRSVASAVKGRDGYAVGAVSVVGPSIRLTRAGVREIAPAVKTCAQEISRELGYNGG